MQVKKAPPLLSQSPTSGFAEFDGSDLTPPVGLIFSLSEMQFQRFLSDIPFTINPGKKLSLREGTADMASVLQWVRLRSSLVRVASS